MVRTVKFDFPECSDVHLFNPLTHDRKNPLYERHIPGGRTVVMTACWQAREMPIFRGLGAGALSIEEQLYHARVFYPGAILNRMHVGVSGGGEADVLRSMRERMERQEQQLRQAEEQLRREYCTRMNDDRARLQARLASMSGDQIRNLSQEEAVHRAWCRVGSTGTSESCSCSSKSS